MSTVDHLPLPNLASYSALSALSFAVSLGYALSSEKGFYGALQGEIWCTWALLNMACCCLFLFGKFLVSYVFGSVRVSEQQHLRDKFWNFVFYKFIFLFGVMDVQDLRDISGWCMWFVALGFLSLISELCKDRFEYLSFSPRVSTSSHVKIVALLGGIILSSGGLLMICAVVGWQFGFSHFAFLCSEVFILSSTTVHTLIRYMVYLWDMHHSTPWENEGVYLHYFEVILELGALVVDFIHHLHMIMWGYWFPSMASLVLMMRLRFLYQEIQLRLRKHHTYLQVSTNLDNRFPAATDEEVSTQTQCSICWEGMTQARKLPCNHMFHMYFLLSELFDIRSVHESGTEGCLRSWLQYDLSCPVCRQPLREVLGMIEPNLEATDHPNTRAVENRIPLRSRLLHFNGSSLASWLPTFSVELHNDDDVWMQEADNLHRSAERIQHVFPNVPLAVIIIDLTRTKSVNQTIENIVNQTVYTPAPSGLPVSQSTAQNDDQSPEPEPTCEPDESNSKP